MLLSPAIWTTRVCLQFSHKALERQTKPQWLLRLHQNNLGQRTVMGRRGLYVEGGVGVVEEAQEDEESKVDARGRKIWGVRNGGV